MNLEARLIKIENRQTGQGKNGEWQKQNFIFETEGQYPKKVCVTIWGTKMDETVKAMKIGNLYSVAYDLESREFNGNWFTDVRAWQITPVGESQSGSNTSPSPAPIADIKKDESEDDLPF